MMFRSKVLLLLSVFGLAIDVVKASGATTCAAVDCAPGYACQMMKPRYCYYCAKQPRCVPSTSCEGVECPAGEECQIQQPPPYCSWCQPRVVCSPVSQSCDRGEAYDYQLEACVVVSCKSDDACIDTTCRPVNPGLRYCQRKYAETGVPCKYFECETAPTDPCAAATCPVGNKCTVVHTSAGPQAKCVCDTPTYAVDSDGTCVPNSCEALNACPQDVGCKNEYDPETGKPYTCIYDQSCDYGYVFDEYYEKCVPDPCEDKTCPIGSKCVLTHSGSIPTDCVCDTPTYVFSSFDQKCVPNTCDAPNACPDDAYCEDGAHPDCGGHCREYTCTCKYAGYEYDREENKCVDTADACHNCGHGHYCDSGHCCPEGTAWDSYEKKCVAIVCDAPDPCPGDKVCYDQVKPCTASPGCPHFRCEDPDTNPCSYTTCPEYYTCDPGSGECCPPGTDYDGSECVPVTCEADPCEDDEDCLDDPKQCITTPCEQYKCVPVDPCYDVHCQDGYSCSSGVCCPDGKVYDPEKYKCVWDGTPTDDLCSRVRCGYNTVCEVIDDQARCVCGDNFEWNPKYRQCTPKNCNAEGVCPGKECISYDRQCHHSGPCPKYYCK